MLEAGRDRLIDAGPRRQCAVRAGRCGATARLPTRVLIASRSALACATSPTSRARWPPCGACSSAAASCWCWSSPSRPTPSLEGLYDAYSFRVLPLLGRIVAGDADSYRYLAESIRRHPDQETLLAMMQRGRAGRVPLPQSDGRHCRRASRLPLLDARRATQRLPGARTRGVRRARSELCAALEGRRLELQIEGIPGALCVAAAERRARRPRTPAAARKRPTAPPTSRCVAVRLGLLALAARRCQRCGACAAVPASKAMNCSRSNSRNSRDSCARISRPPWAASSAAMPAHLATRALTLLAAWGRAARESVARNAADYLAHESRDLVPRAEAEGLFLGRRGAALRR